MINVKMGAPLVLSPAALDDLAEAASKAMNPEDVARQVRTESPDIEPRLMDEILKLVDKPRTTLNTLRMNKLLKKAGLGSSFGHHKGKL